MLHVSTQDAKRQADKEKKAQAAADKAAAKAAAKGAGSGGGSKGGNGGRLRIAGSEISSDDAPVIQNLGQFPMVRRIPIHVIDVPEKLPQLAEAIMSCKPFIARPKRGVQIMKLMNVPLTN